MAMLKWLPNILTSLRIVLTVVWIYLIRLVEVNEAHKTLINAAVILFIIICLTDLIDGKVARKMKASSRFGSFFDVIADLIFISSSNIVLSLYGSLPRWFILVILFKFSEFLITSKLIKKYGDLKSSFFVFDHIGRVAAVNFFLIPGAFMLGYEGLDLRYGYILLYITLMLVIISAFSRIWRCYKVRNKMRTREKFV